jgi:uncharacterized repeat protein (TIGR01451 family)
MTTHSQPWRGWPLLLLALCAPAWCGCAGGIPRIDPTGRGLFIVDPPPGSSSLTTIPAPATGAAVPGCAPMVSQPIVVPPVVVQPAPALPPPVVLPAAPVAQPVTPPVMLQLAPSDTIAPVGSEVILVATVPPSQQLLHSRHRVEWTVAPSSAGHIASISQQTPCEWLFGGPGAAQKIDANYAISSTATRNYLLNRGTPTPTDDLPITVGQTWMSVTSPQEGVSYVSAFTPQLGGFDARQRDARVYWVDAQWSFPPSTTTSAGGRQALSTSVVRLSDRTPLAGYAVRYSIIGGAPAGLGTSDGQALEIDTNAAGEANVDIMQRTPSPGTTEVRVEIIRPATLGGFDGRTLTVAAGITRVMWTGSGGVVSTPPPPPITPPVTPPPVATPPVAEEPAAVAPTLPQLGIDISAPPAAVVGDPVNFTITVTNLGATPTPALIIRDRYGEGLIHEHPDNPLETDLAPLQPNETLESPIGFTTTLPGMLQHTVSIILKDPQTGREQVLQQATGSVLVTNPPAVDIPAETPYEQPIEETPPSIPSTETAPLPDDIQLEISGQLSAKTGEEVLFRIRVTNTSDRDLNDVTVLNQFDPQLSPIQVSGKEGGHRRIGEDIEWLPIATLPAGKSKSFQVKYRCLAPSQGAKTSVTVNCRERLREDDQATIAITEGATTLSATIFESRNPVRVGSTTSYNVDLVNNGQSAAANVSVTVTLPRELAYVAIGSQGPNGSTPRASGDTVQFAPLAELRPKETVRFIVNTKANSPGTAVVTAEITSSGMASPLVREKRTDVIAQ